MPMTSRRKTRDTGRHITRFSMVKIIFPSSNVDRQQIIIEIFCTSVSNYIDYLAALFSCLILEEKWPISMRKYKSVYILSSTLAQWVPKSLSVILISIDHFCFQEPTLKVTGLAQAGPGRASGETGDTEQRRHEVRHTYSPAQ